MIHYSNFDIFETMTDAIVNPCNCVGVAGKGLSLAFKQKMPKYFRAYKKVCDEKGLILGGLHYWKKDEEYVDIPTSYIFSLPTKHHWREKSYIEPITDSLNKLWVECKNLDLKSVAIPALGCGLGGLDWNLVHRLILSSADNSIDITSKLDIVLIPPKNYEERNF